MTENQIPNEVTIESTKMDSSKKVTLKSSTNSVAELIQMAGELIK